ncbi:MAG TPA: hypothetical protein VM575_16025 [Nocardioides sp.]|nr:hypothetical protein [Nocardioides sp.]
MSSQSSESKVASAGRYVLVVVFLVGMLGAPGVWLSGLDKERKDLRELPDCGATVSGDCLELRTGTIEYASSRKARRKGKATFEAEDGERDGITLAEGPVLGDEVSGIYHDGDLIGIDGEQGRRWEKFGASAVFGLPPLGHVGISVLLVALMIGSGFGINLLNRRDPGGQAAREAKAAAAREKLNRRFG